MEMLPSGNGGRKVVTFDDAITGMRRNGSLSSYLDMGRAAPRPLPAVGMGSRRRTYADGELDVFSAERYFRGAMDGDGERKEGASAGDTAITPAVAVQVVEPLVETAAGRPPATEAVVMAKPSSTTVSFTASSASSANSRTALFGGGLRRRRSSRDNKCCVQVGVLMRTCSGKRSVRVDGCAAKEAPDATAETAATGIDWYRELRMHKAALGLSGDGNSHGLVAAGLPPSFNRGTAKVAAIGREVTGEGEEEEAAELTFSGSIRRRIRSNFTLVAPVRANVPASGEAGGAGKGGHGGGVHHPHVDDDDDGGSESSSDLFEIKSLTIGDCPYEPSEASIQWSVVTASAADTSERGDRVPARWVSGGGARGSFAGRQLRGHRPPGLLAGCASHRALDVSAAATKAVPNAVAAVQQRRSGRFQMAPSGA